jgi:hypothetical protein
MKRAGFAECVFVHRCKCWGACLPAKAGGRIARKTTETGMFYYRVLGPGDYLFIVFSIKSIKSLTGLKYGITLSLSKSNISS